MLEKVKPEEIDWVLEKGLNREQYKEISARPDEPIRRSKRTDVEGDIIYIKKDTSIYDQNLRMVIDKIKELVVLELPSPVVNHVRRLTVRDIYIILNKKYVDITLSKTKELHRYAKNELGL
jgi:hypothetical protein